jgi:hypothetical protein
MLPPKPTLPRSRMSAAYHPKPAVLIRVALDGHVHVFRSDWIALKPRIVGALASLDRPAPRVECCQDAAAPCLRLERHQASLAGARCSVDSAAYPGFPAQPRGGRWAAPTLHISQRS